MDQKCIRCETEKSIKFCAFCPGKFCQECFDFEHRKKDHDRQVSIIEELPREMICLKHKEDIISYCLTCHTFLCFKCITKGGYHIFHEHYPLNQVEKEIEKQLKEYQKNIEEYKKENIEIEIFKKEKIEIEKEIEELKKEIENKSKEIEIKSQIIENQEKYKSIYLTYLIQNLFKFKKMEKKERKKEKEGLLSNKFQDMIELNEMIQDIQILNIHDKLSQQQCILLSEYLINNQMIHRLNIYRNDLDIKGEMSLMNIFKYNSSIEILLYNSIIHQSLFILGESLKVNQILNTIIFKNEIKDKDIYLLKESISFIKNIIFLNTQSITKNGYQLLNEFNKEMNIILFINDYIYDKQDYNNNIFFIERGHFNLKNELSILNELLKNEYQIQSLKIEENIHFSFNLDENQSLKELIIQNQRLTKREMNEILKSFQFKDNLLFNNDIKYLYLNNDQISDDSLIEISKIFKFNSSIEYLSLTSNDISDSSMNIFCKNIKFNNSLKSINLTNNKITNQSLEYIKELLSFNKNINHIYLFKNQIQHQDIHLEDSHIYIESPFSFIEDIYLYFDPSSLHKISNDNLLFNYCKDDEFYKLLNFIKNYKKQFKYLELNNTNLDLYKLKELSKILKDSSIETLSLSSCLIDNDLFLEIYHLKLKNLILSYNKLTDNEMIERYIKENNQLKFLNLSFNQIKKEIEMKNGFIYLYSNEYNKDNSLELKIINNIILTFGYLNDKLLKKEIDFSKSNEIELLFNFLLKENSFQKMNLSKNKINIEKFIKILESSESLEYLDLSECQLKDSDLEKFKFPKNLKMINLFNNPQISISCIEKMESKYRNIEFIFTCQFMKYSNNCQISRNNKRIEYKGNEWNSILCSKSNKCNFEIKNGKEGIMIGMVSIQHFNENNYSFNSEDSYFLYLDFGTLYGQKYYYNSSFINQNLIKNGNQIGIKYENQEISFYLNSKCIGTPYKNIPIESDLYPCLQLKDEGIEIELINNNFY